VTTLCRTPESNWSSWQQEDTKNQEEVGDLTQGTLSLVSSTEKKKKKEGKTKNQETCCKKWLLYSERH
jgi:hypothetical protein